MLENKYKDLMVKFLTGELWPINRVSIKKEKEDAIGSAPSFSFFDFIHAN